MLNRLMAINEEEMIGSIAKMEEAAFAVMNRRQLLEGRDRTGGYLPSYYDDIGEYFKTYKGAVAYMEMKRKISPNKEKPAHIADFFIRGDFHNSIYARISGLSVEHGSTSHIAEDVARKTNYRAFGLNPDSAAGIYNLRVFPVFKKRVSENTGIR